MIKLDLASLFSRDEKCINYAAGETIFKRDEEGKAMYVVLEGQVNIVINGKVLETVPRSGMFGEMALIDESPRSADAVAATECTVTEIDERRFVFLVQETPYFALHVMGILADRLRRETK